MWLGRLYCLHFCLLLSLAFSPSLSSSLSLFLSVSLSLSLSLSLSVLRRLHQQRLSLAAGQGGYGFDLGSLVRPGVIGRGVIGRGSSLSLPLSVSLSCSLYIKLWDESVGNTTWE
jgi:hypothetical protein